MRSAIIFAAFSFLSSVAFSTTVYVPDDFPTIQGAINASSNGDVVIVRPGIYVENIDFGGKPIVVQGQQGASVTTIDGNQAGSVVVFQNGEATDSVLEGFTLTNGSGTPSGGYSYGGGIYCAPGSSPLIIDNVITGNDTEFGGGIACVTSSPQIVNNSITGNQTPLGCGSGIYCADQSAPLISENSIAENWNYGRGGGIYSDASSPTITGNRIYENYVNDRGGGIFCTGDSSPEISNNDISWNISQQGGGICLAGNCSANVSFNSIRENSATYGGGIACAGSVSLTIDSNLIKRNIAYEQGGGIECYNCSTPVVTNNSIVENEADSYGGGMYCENSFSLISNNVIARNLANGYPHVQGEGGGICCIGSEDVISNNIVWENQACVFGGGISAYSSSSPTLVNNTILKNSAITAGGGIGSYTNSSLIIVNSILWDNDAPTGTEAFVGYTSILDISYSDTEGGQASISVDSGSSLIWGAGNIDADPLFVDAANGDLHLACVSPCYGAGDNLAPSLPTVDFEGDPRVIHNNVEMGADEFFCHLYHVGSPVPGDLLGVRVVAIPGQEVFLHRGDDLLEEPYWTGHGYLYITWPAAASSYLGKIPSMGVLSIDVTVPLNWVPGESYPFQAQVGQWGNTFSWLTNLVVLTVE